MYAGDLAWELLLKPMSGKEYKAPAGLAACPYMMVAQNRKLEPER